MILKTTWQEIKRLAQEKSIPLQHVDSSGLTYVLVVDGAFTVHTTLAEGTEDYAEFVANFKLPTARRVATSTSALPDAESWRFRGTSTGWVECPQGSTHVDLVPHTSEDRYVTGGVLLVDSATRGDMVSFSVVHPSGVAVEVYVPSWSVLPGTSQQRIEVYPARIPPSYKLRVNFQHTGETSAHVCVNYLLHKKGSNT